MPVQQQRPHQWAVSNGNIPSFARMRHKAACLANTLNHCVNPQERRDIF
jgi:hypothetical protein